MKQTSEHLQIKIYILPGKFVTMCQDDVIAWLKKGFYRKFDLRSAYMLYVN